MATKRSVRGSITADLSKSKKIKRQVSKETFSKWQRIYESEFQAMSWLRCSMDRSDKLLVSTLWCEVCCKYERRIDSMKNFSRAWIDGSILIRKPVMSWTMPPVSNTKRQRLYFVRMPASLSLATAPLRVAFTIPLWMLQQEKDCKKSLTLVSYLLASLLPNTPLSTSSWSDMELNWDFLTKQENQLTISHTTLQKVKDKNFIKCCLPQTFTVF